MNKWKMKCYDVEYCACVLYIVYEVYQAIVIAHSNIVCTFSPFSFFLSFFSRSIVSIVCRIGSVCVEKWSSKIYIWAECREQSKCVSVWYYTDCKAVQTDDGKKGNETKM